MENNHIEWMHFISKRVGHMVRLLDGAINKMLQQVRDPHHHSSTTITTILLKTIATGGTSCCRQMYKQIICTHTTQQLTLVKHLDMIASTGIIAHCKSCHYNASCPCCAEPNKTHNHVIWCPALSCQNWWHHMLQGMDAFMPWPNQNLCSILHNGTTAWTLSILKRILLGIMNFLQNLIGRDHLYRAR